MIMGNGQEITTTIETIEFFTVKLDSMLFEIPPSYQEAKTADELQDKIGMKDIMNNVKKEMNENTAPACLPANKRKPA